MCGEGGYLSWSLRYFWPELVFSTAGSVASGGLLAYLVLTLSVLTLEWVVLRVASICPEGCPVLKLWKELSLSSLASACPELQGELFVMLLHAVL